MRFFFSILIFILLSQSLNAQSLRGAQKLAYKVVFKEQSDGSVRVREAFSHTEDARLVAIALNITLGVFGTHRMYLGTELKVPIFYTLTVGGACVLWVVDLGLLIFADDIDKFKDNPNIFMWNEKPTGK
jgi:TM2 domain-containing membrane protein YozV